MAKGQSASLDRKKMLADPVMMTTTINENNLDIEIVGEPVSSDPAAIVFAKTPDGKSYKDLITRPEKRSAYHRQCYPKVLYAYSTVPAPQNCLTISRRAAD